MQHIHLQSQELEIVFDNAESILVDEFAIRDMRFNTVCDRYIWNSQHKQFFKATVVRNLRMSLDLGKPNHFHHQVRTVDNGSTSEMEGNDCIERLKKSDDICHFYINGTCFEVPWKRKNVIRKVDNTEICCGTNLWQHNSTTYNSEGDKWLEIEIGEPDDKIYIYQGALE